MAKSGISYNKEVTTLSNGVNIYSPEAFKKLQESCIVGKTIREELVSAAVEGTTTLELERLAERLLVKYKCSPLFKGQHGYPFVTCLSNNSQIVHGFPDNRKLKNGDVLSVDIGVRHPNGYCADNARTVIVGGIESAHSKLVKLGEDSFTAGLSAAVPGNTEADIASAIFKVIVSERVDNNFKNPSVYKIFDRFRGHGIGKELHEEPSVPNWGNPGCGQTLLAGMCICIEPVIVYNSSKILDKPLKGVSRYYTHDGLPSTHYENQVFITENGPIVLT